MKAISGKTAFQKRLRWRNNQTGGKPCENAWFFWIGTV